MASVAALAAASVVGMGTALFVSKRQAAKLEEEKKEALRRQKIKYSQRYKKTAEY